jgi:hypothetical protein
MSPLLLADWKGETPAVPDLPPVFETRHEDVEQDELARVDALFHDLYGRDETRWTPRVTRGYLTSVAAIHEHFHPQEVAA